MRRDPIPFEGLHLLDKISLKAQLPVHLKLLNLGQGTVSGKVRQGNHRNRGWFRSFWQG
jgi:hypothetical protein